MKKYMIMILLVAYWSCEEVDETPPSLIFTQGGEDYGSFQSKPVPIQIMAFDESGVEKIEFFVGDSLIFTKQGVGADTLVTDSGFYLFPWDYEHNQSVEYEAFAYDIPGNQGKISYQFIARDQGDNNFGVDLLKASVKDDGVKFVWSKSEYSFFEKYNIYNELDDEGEEKELIYSTTDINDTTYRATGLDLSQYLFFCVTVQNQDGVESICSNSMELGGFDEGFNGDDGIVVVNENNNILISWDHHSINVSEHWQDAFTSFELHEGSSDDMVNSIKIFETNDFNINDYTVTDFPPNTTKYYRVSLIVGGDHHIYSDVKYGSSYDMSHFSITLGDADSPTRGYAIEIDNDDNYIIAGQVGNNSDFLMRVDEDGNEIWTSIGVFSSDGSVSGHRSLSITAENNIAVTGISGWGGGPDALFAIYDFNGDTILSNSYQYARYNHGQDVRQTEDGGYILGIASFGGATGTGMYDPKLAIKLDALGNTSWTASYEWEGARSIQQTSDGGYISCGTYLTKIDSTGSIEWLVEDVNGLFVHEADDGTFVVFLDENMSDDDIDGYDYAFRNYDNEGNELWTSYIEENVISGAEHPNFGNIVRCISTNDQGYALIGNADLDNNQCTLVKFNSMGEYEWARSYLYNGWYNSIKGYAVAQHENGSFVIVGIESNTNMIIMKTDPNGHHYYEK